MTAPSTAGVGVRPATPRLSDGRIDVAAAARELVTGLLSEPWGQVSPSVYETGRLVTMAPWLPGHDSRVAFLTATQRTDGGWGAPDGYALVPTLSATEALLGAGPAMWEAASRGLRCLFDWLGPDATWSGPDTPAVELIVPTLVTLINQRLDRAAQSGSDTWWGSSRLTLPSGLDSAGPAAVRSRLQGATALPDKLLHALEIAGDAATAARWIRPVPPGTVGASPAATAAWLGNRRSSQVGVSAVRYLESVTGGFGGPAPCAMPITEFERSWVLATLAGAGIDVDVPAELLCGLTASLGDTGTSGGAGLPPDADTTAVTLHALAELGVGCDPHCLSGYELPTHFATWPGEHGHSTSVNAHVLEAFGSWPGTPAGQLTTVDKISRWLCDQQRPDGSWVDRWHVSAYYATVCCVLALDRFGRGASSPAVHSAVRWVLANQHTDGSWGRWGGTVEETAYAMQILLQRKAPLDELVAGVAARGYAYLVGAIDGGNEPALWIDKDLYLPVAVVRAATLGAVHLAQRRAGLGSESTHSGPK